ncbi:MAG: UbiA family prenyltransferase [Planctomycetes bacterium]|nr:UbiA family prenyltransferase [Planctomycetota bacterium]MCP4772192.1 UbiA family prenyltransferase [Planctomycetota bacterium]MCP4861248.1 UbiA family prenyltransferase [Planctomycetota bacterium]
MTSLGTTLRMIKFEHTVFALPFALAGAWLAAGGLPPWMDLVLIVIAAVAARSAAMAFNRISDRNIDSSNPRTADRELVTGVLSMRFAVLFTLVNSAVFVAVAFFIAPICGWLSLPVLLVLLGYSKLKRFSWLCHMGLGLALGLAPAGAWLAINKDFVGGWDTPLWVGLGVLAWVTGFDLLYAIQDIEHDRQEGLFSFPARFGASISRYASMLLYVVALAAWFMVGQRAGLGIAFGLGLVLVAALLSFEHWLLRGERTERVPLVFFKVNAWVGVVFFAGLWIDMALAEGAVNLG